MKGTIMIDGVLCDYHTRKPVLLSDDGSATISIDSSINANITVMDAKIEPGVSARQRYIDKINTPPKSESTLFKEYREGNIRRILGGIAPYTTPENGGVES